MSTWIDTERTVEGQGVEVFTGEGAYHGSTPVQRTAPPPPTGEVPEEKRPTTLTRYLAEGRTTIESFDAQFPNQLRLVGRLGAPSQDEVRNDRVTFVWCPFDEALRRAGPLTHRVLLGMAPGLVGDKRYTYVDSKIQFFEKGDLPVDSCLRHVDGSIVVRDTRVLGFGATVLHDMRARVEGAKMARYMAYQSSGHCATGFLDRPLKVRIPELIRNFNEFDAVVRAANAHEVIHAAGDILGYDGLTTHWATPSLTRGWRLWVRCTETDVENLPGPAVIACYGKVYRP